MTQPKLIYVASAREGVGDRDFTARWRAHAALGMSQARWKNIARYLHCDRIDAGRSVLHQWPCNGVATVAYRSEEARLRHLADEEARARMKADEKQTFLLPVSQTALLTSGIVRKAGPEATFRLFVFWRGVSGGFEDAWLAAGEKAAALARSTAAVAGYVQNLALVPRADRREGLDCDGVDELWSDDAEALIDFAHRAWGLPAGLADRSIVLTRSVVLHDAPGVPE